MNWRQNIYKRYFPSKLKKWIHPEQEVLNRFIMTHAQLLRPDERALDAGAGECRYKHYFTNHRYYAIDTAVGDVDWDYSKLDAIGELECMPFADSSFDLVICTQVLEHVREPQQVLFEFYRVLKKGGRLCLSAPQGWGVHQAPNDFFRFTEYGLSHLFCKAGFQEINIQPTCGYFGYLANRLTVFPKTLFWQRDRFFRILFFPLELLSYVFFVLLFPMILNRMDILDRNRQYTLNYLVDAIKSPADQRKTERAGN